MPNKYPRNPNNTTMDKLAGGAVFAFGYDNPNGTEFEKISNVYAKCVKDGKVGPNSTDPNDAAQIKVTYLRRRA